MRGKICVVGLPVWVHHIVHTEDSQNKFHNSVHLAQPCYFDTNHKEGMALSAVAAVVVVVVERSVVVVVGSKYHNLKVAMVEIIYTLDTEDIKPMKGKTASSIFEAKELMVWKDNKNDNNLNLIPPCKTNNECKCDREEVVGAQVAF